MKLIRVSSAEIEGPPVYINPDDVVRLHAAGIPGCTVVSSRTTFPVIVKGDVDDVYALLRAEE